VLSTFAVVALLLVVVGVYGVTAYNVGRLNGEIGLRIALGATRGAIMRIVLGGELGFISQGLALGVLAGFGLTSTLSALIFGISATDPATFGMAVVLLGAVALIACIIPARRAMRVDPLVALRAE
jgi:putative ABC transport system permease protein